MLGSLARRLSDVLGVDFVFVGRVVGDNLDRVRTLVALIDGEIRENIEYELENTPCDLVMKSGSVSYASDVQSRFPLDQQLVEMGVQSYLGSALCDSTGQAFGLVSVMSRAPIKNTETHESLLQIFASRAAAEIERQQAERSLQETQSELAHIARVMITGELAATIAHEVNQPLTAMVANANATRRMLGNGNADLDEAREAIDDIVKDAHRASQVVARIRSLVRKGPHRTEPLAINGVTEEVVAILRNDLVGKKVSLRMDLAEGLPKVEADRVEIQQVMLNLMINAVEAMRTVEEGGRNLLIRTARNESGGVLVEVQDSGVGIASENLDRIFDAFYTTRPEGMGMGLSICRTIIEAHGGKLWAESIKDKRATFRFILPVSVGEAGETPALPGEA
jgi:C4-dicarboxylate-specific signal transduction histidine kinase